MGYWIWPLDFALHPANPTQGCRSFQRKLMATLLIIRRGISAGVWTSWLPGEVFGVWVIIMYPLSAVFPYCTATFLKRWFLVLASHWNHPGPASDQLNQNLWPWNSDISMFIKLPRRFQWAAKTEDYWGTGVLYLIRFLPKGSEEWLDIFKSLLLCLEDDVDQCHTLLVRGIGDEVVFIIIIIQFFTLESRQ